MIFVLVEAARNIKSVVEGDKAMSINCRIFLNIIATCGGALYAHVCGVIVGGLMVAVWGRVCLDCMAGLVELR